MAGNMAVVDRLLLVIMPCISDGRRAGLAAHRPAEAQAREGPGPAAGRRSHSHAPLTVFFTRIIPTEIHRPPEGGAYSHDMVVSSHV